MSFFKHAISRTLPIISSQLLARSIICLNIRSKYRAVIFDMGGVVLPSPFPMAKGKYFVILIMQMHLGISVKTWLCGRVIRNYYFDNNCNCVFCLALILIVTESHFLPYFFYLKL